MESVKVGDAVRIIIPGFFFRKVGSVKQLQVGKYAGDLLVGVVLNSPEQLVFFRHDELERVRI